MSILLPSRTFKRFAVLGRKDADLQRRLLSNVGLVKTDTSEVEKAGERTLRFTITTEAVDREQDSIALKGWELANYRKNPVVLWSHASWDYPVGRAFDIERNKSKMSASVKFIPPDGSYGEAGKRADVVYNLALDGWVSATSVGFVPLEWEFSEDKSRGGDSWWPGIDFIRQELVEFSLCTVPANPEALIEPPDAPDDDKQAIRTDRARRRRMLQLIEAEARSYGL